MGGPVFLYLQLLSAAAMLYSRAAALCPKSFLMQVRLTRVKECSPSELRGPQPRHSGGPLFISAHSRGLRRLPPENISVIMYATL